MAKRTRFGQSESLAPASPWPLPRRRAGALLDAAPTYDVVNEPDTSAAPKQGDAAQSLYDGVRCEPPRNTAASRPHHPSPSPPTVPSQPLALTTSVRMLTSECQLVFLEV